MDTATQYEIVTKQVTEFGVANVALYAAVFTDGYHTVWYDTRERAVAAAERRCAAT
jgi:hypothetical protein